MFRAVRARRVSDEIAGQVKGAMLAGTLRAGDRLPPERELAAEFEASRASVREALRSLEQEGVVAIRKGVKGGIFVADLDHRPVAKSLQTLLELRKLSMAQIAEARLIFEPEAARLAARRVKPEDLQEMEKVIQKMGEAVSRRLLPRSHDLRFHQLVARAAANPILEMLAGSLLEAASKTITDLKPGLPTLRQVLKAHQNIFEAIRGRDPDRAFLTMRRHIVDVQRRLAQQAREQAVKESPAARP